MFVISGYPAVWLAGYGRYRYPAKISTLVFSAARLLLLLLGEGKYRYRPVSKLLVIWLLLFFVHRSVGQYGQLLQQLHCGAGHCRPGIRVRQGPRPQRPLHSTQCIVLLDPYPTWPVKNEKKPSCNFAREAVPLSLAIFFIILCWWLSPHNCSVKVYIYQNKGRAFLPRSWLMSLFILLLACVQCTALHIMRRINLAKCYGQVSVSKNPFNCLEELQQFWNGFFRLTIEDGTLPNSRRSCLVNICCAKYEEKWV